ncbi:hypothetical protein [Cellulosimicrobium marinum]|uniref:hypothetical protein n=1 Tax=Cellulosimicrobium marinum TaxID=1638992 RepID=UPI001E5DBF3B|nr:hypothetical protein [Cellulosimicrobium marinum]MCB7138208.1 hypothetical protein [Cellulosimicrobium marinum]
MREWVRVGRRRHGGLARAGAEPGLLATGRYVVTYGLVWLCAVAVLATDVAVMLNRGAPWRGDLIWTIDWISIGFVLVGPIIAGLVAVDTVRLGAGVKDLPLSRGRSGDLTVALTYGVTLGVLHLVVTLATVMISGPPVLDPGAPLAVLAQVAMLGFFVALGSVVGRFAPPVLGGIGAALAALVAVYLLSSPGADAGLLYGGAATTPRLGYAYDTAWLVVQVLALVVVIVALWAVRPAPSASLSRRALIPALAGVVVLAAGAAPSTMPGERLEATGAHPDACGALAGVPWCYYPQHERVVGLYADDLLALFDAASEHGYDGLVPLEVAEADQRTWPGDETTGAFSVTPEVLAGARPDLWETAVRLVEPVHCTQLQGDLPPGEAYWDDLTALTATWVGLVDAELPEHYGYVDEPLTPAEAQTLLAQFRTCTYPFA